MKAASQRVAWIDEPEASPSRTSAAASTAAQQPQLSGSRSLADLWGPSVGLLFAEYLQDISERTILFWDALRQRADNMLEHERAGLPPLLDFKFEMILDARRFECAANYALLRIIEVGDDCWEDCVDPAKPPVVIVDPRAGHGPGIGGFKRDSEVGMAMHEGHSVYFVIFFPEPEHGQTLADVLHALRRFVVEVSRRHPGKPPILYGNCQAGWALTLISADCRGLTGPVVLNGSPLSYWAGEAGTNPMRVSGALSGGAWLAHLMADLGDGRFDGAWLAQNFESLVPEKAIWEKYANLFHQIDDERERFLEFERWWNGFYFLSREEILAIVENLFIGNKLEQGRLRICDGCVADLRTIANPVVIFASYGDDITPPHQALGWIPIVFRDTADLKTCGQRIVYMTNPHVGHLGIFVSAKVARLEHRAILESLDEIEALEPGLYEMKVDNPSGDPDCHKPHFIVRFEPRQVEDLRTPADHATFERVRHVSEFNDALYSSIVSPWVQVMTNPLIAETLKWIHPMRVSRHVYSERFNLWMRGLAIFADAIRKDRTPLPKSHPLLVQERDVFKGIGEVWARLRLSRDASLEEIFKIVYTTHGEVPRGQQHPGLPTS